MPRFVLLALMVLLPGGVRAEGYYCGSRIVDIGTRVDQVLSWCGQPVTVDRNFVERSFGVGLTQQGGLILPGGGFTTYSTTGINGVTTTRVTVEVQKWTYPGNGNTLPRFLWIENGIVTDVKAGMY
jgi:hypothetical protein